MRQRCYIINELKYNQRDQKSAPHVAAQQGIFSAQANWGESVLLPMVRFLHDPAPHVSATRSLNMNMIEDYKNSNLYREIRQRMGAGPHTVARVPSFRQLVPPL